MRPAGDEPCNAKTIEATGPGGAPVVPSPTEPTGQGATGVPSAEKCSFTPAKRAHGPFARLCAELERRERADGHFPYVSGRQNTVCRAGAPNGIRTRAAALKERCPGPLDDGGRAVREHHRSCHSVPSGPSRTST